MGLLTQGLKTVADWIKAGYPEEVAKRIVSGELPMDEASRVARAQEQGYGPVLYHGSTNPDLTEIAPMEVGNRNATGGSGLFLTDNPRVASTYAYDARVNGGKGPDGATIYPLRVRDTGRDDWVTVKDRGHKGEEYSTWWDEIPAENIRGMDTDMYEAGQRLETDQINRTANRQGKKLVEYTKLYDSGEDVYSVGGTEVPSNVTAVLDNTLVRSPSAAFDPTYKGSNIMGGLLAGGVGLGALGQSGDADAGVATSLVELILRKFGNNIDGATQELVRVGGFPEPVARRIATGELPMDAESVAKRAQDQGYGDTLYHGTTHDIQSFSPSGGTLSDWGEGTYLTDSAGDASRNYAGTHGADFQGKLKRTKRSMDLSDNEEFFGVDEIDDNLLTTKALDLLKGKNDGVVYPLRVKQEGLLNVTEEFPEEAWEEIGGIMGKYDIEGDIMPHEHQAQFVGRIIDENGSRMMPEEIAVLEKYAPQGHTGVVDVTTPERYSGMGAGNHTVIFPGNENQIRSVNAAFDPEYTGSNIMGGLALPVAAGLLAAGQSEDADAGFITKGGKTLLEAWHGSPHKFDRFSMDQIGTGEGAQAYGHGLYFADSEDVARGYRDALTQISPTALDGFAVPDSAVPYLQKVFDGDDPIMSSAASELLAGDFSPSHIRSKVAEWADIEGIDAGAALESYDAMLKKIPGDGALYRAEIDVTPESLLDWDKPLSEQSELVQGFMNRVAERAPFDGTVRNADGTLEPDASGKMLYEWLYGQRNGPDMTLMDRQANTSRALNKNGIKGIKYLDGDSRAAGNGTSNYVIFDDSLINIAERGNADPRLLAGTAAGTAGLLAAPMVKDSGMISAPRSENLFDLTMGARDLERRLEGSPASLLFPSGLIDYLETVNSRVERPSWGQRGAALLDVLPF